MGDNTELLIMFRIRQAIGDPGGKLMQDEVALRIEMIVAENVKLREAMEAAYVNNQNMHCFVTKGRMNAQLNEQTVTLRTALAKGAK